MQARVGCGSARLDSTRLDSTDPSPQHFYRQPRGHHHASLHAARCTPNLLNEVLKHIGVEPKALRITPAATRLAGVVCLVKDSATGATGCTGLLCQFFIDANQELKELDVLKDGVAHWDGLSS